MPPPRGRAPVGDPLGLVAQAVADVRVAADDRLTTLAARLAGVASSFTALDTRVDALEALLPRGRVNALAQACTDNTAARIYWGPGAVLARGILWDTTNSVWTVQTSMAYELNIVVAVERAATPLGIYLQRNRAGTQIRLKADEVQPPSGITWSWLQINCTVDLVVGDALTCDVLPGASQGGFSQAIKASVAVGASDFEQQWSIKGVR